MRSIRERVSLLTLAAVAALVVSHCGGGSTKTSQGTPTTPLVPTLPPPPPVEPTAQPLSASCERLPLGSANHRCRDESPSFLVEVGEAIEDLKRQRPEFFRDGNIVTNIGGYYVGIIKNLDAKGICASYDGEELAVKNAAEFSDQYKVLTSWNQVRNFYIGTCYPAVFPLSRDEPAPSPAGCSLAPSTEIACGRPDPLFLGDVEGAIDLVMAQRPELFDPSQTSNGGVLVRDLDAYTAAVMQVLTQRGYCAIHDGEEIQVKRSNEFTEHYDINYADRYTRRGPNSYRGACYPAAF